MARGIAAEARIYAKSPSKITYRNLTIQALRVDTGDGGGDDDGAGGVRGVSGGGEDIGGGGGGGGGAVAAGDAGVGIYTLNQDDP